MRKLIFDKKEWGKLQKVCEEGYPKEVCGLILGKVDISSDSQKKVARIECLENILNGKHPQRLAELVRAEAISISKERAVQGGNFEFVIDPQEHYEKVLKAQSEGLDQIGIFHSHPDHPAMPSATDASQPFLAGWSNIIVAVHKGKFKEARSWFREIEDSTFQEENIFVE